MKKHIKSIQFILILSFLLLFLAGCQGNDQPAADNSAPPEPATEAVDDEQVEAEPEVDPEEPAEEEPEPVQEEMEVEEAQAEPESEPAESEESGAETEMEPAAGFELPETVLISQILSGIAGNNNYDFITLYNNTGAEVDLKGYRLMYQPRPTDEPELLYRWRDFTPFVAGHFVLGREGETFDTPVDATFELQVFNRGSLALMDPDGAIVDLVGWGDDMPEKTYVGTAAPKIPRGQMLARLLDGSAAGESNADQFILQTEPVANGCTNDGIRIDVPSEIAPGKDFSITISLDDPDSVESLSILIPAGYSAGGAEPFGSAIYQTFEGPLTDTQIITLQAPVTLQESVFRGSKAIVNGTQVCLPAVQVKVDGVLPIAIARGLINKNVTIEGVATMFTDGFFAGSSGTKFYIEDETGGVQIFVPGGKGGVSVAIGDRVRVTGKTEFYRTALEVIPQDFDSQIEIIESAAEPSQPTAIGIDEALGDAAQLGNFVEVNGIVERVEEFNYSFEVDLVDEDGKKLLVYLDKLTDVSVLELNEGDEFTVAGILESWDGKIQLYPRVQADFAKVWPEEIRVEAIVPAAISVSPIDYQIKINNNTSETQTNLLVTAPRPEGDVETVIVDNGVTATREIINWLIPQLDPGQSVTLNMSVALINPNSETATDEQVLFFPVRVTSDQSPDPAKSPGRTVFTSGILPIWAIQGTGDKSPYVGQVQTTAGIVIGVFPELGGLFIQTQNSDDNISTSDAMFVSFDDQAMPGTLTTGMQINVTGEITELSGQTAIEIADEADIAIISSTDLVGSFEPVALTPPAEGDILAYFEAREGMLVSLDGYAVAVGPTNRFGEFPLYPLSLSDNLYPNAPLIFRDPSDNRSDGIIYVDDGSEAEYESGNELPIPIATGDIVSNVVGPLAYTFGNYKIEPISPANIIVEPSTYAEKGLTIPEPRTESQVAIATFNVENFFDILNPHPSSPPVPTREEYGQKLTKLSASFAMMGYPEIVGLQEVENLKVLQDLAEEIVAAGGPAYEGHLLEGSDGRGIDVAYMTRVDRVSLVALEQRSDSDGTLSREPLLLRATVALPDGDQEIVLINNHFTSLGGGEEATLPRRTAQADWNVGLVTDLMAENPEANIVVLGDLNSFRETPPLDNLEAHLTHIYDGLAGSSTAYPTYTYIYQGVAQSLDHILVSDPLIQKLINVIALPINADYPLPLEDDESPYRVSDHNPLIAIFEFGAQE